MSRVQDMCVRGQGEVHQRSRRIALGVKEKFVGGKEEVPHLNTTQSGEALLLDPQRTIP